MNNIPKHWKKVLDTINEAITIEYKEVDSNMTDNEEIQKRKDDNSFDGVMTWSMDKTIATLLQHMLKRYSECSQAIINEDELFKNIDSMIKWFKEYSEDVYEDKCSEIIEKKHNKEIDEDEFKTQMNKQKYGLQLFKENFEKLWN